jgi:hypothetical protein
VEVAWFGRLILERWEDPMEMNDQSTATADDGVIGTLDAWPRVAATPQVAEYIREMTAELTRMANSANCLSLSYLLAITNLEARKLAQKGGCELPTQ